MIFHTLTMVIALGMRSLASIFLFYVLCMSAFILIICWTEEKEQEEESLQ
jgi:hypothetical protein